MHWENDFYGHRAVLGQVIGSDVVVPRFRAHLQHGWAPFSPVGHRERLARRLRYLAWSERDVEVLGRLGIRDAQAIGAPFLYLRRLLGCEQRGSLARPGDGSMIVYPAHGWERERMAGNHAQFIAEIRERASGPVTVCLYWVEFRQHALRRLYEEAGFRVISHGIRSDPGFLWRQAEELGRHDVVAANHLSTAVWYGGALGRDIVRFGPEFTIYGERYRKAWGTYQRTRWPEFSDGVVPGPSAVALAERELGFGAIRPADELAVLLDPLDPTRRWASQLEHRATNLELTGRRVVAVARSRVQTGRIESRDMARMEAARR